MRRKGFVVHLVVAVLLVLLSLSTFYEFSTAAQKELKSVNSEISQLKTALSSNTSQVLSQANEIDHLKKEIQDLKSALAQKQTENEKLKNCVDDLQCAICEIENDLASLVQIEQIQLVVERLRNEPELTD